MKIYEYLRKLGVGKVSKEKNFRFSDSFYENLGDLKTELKNSSLIDQARFYLASKFIIGDSLLDIGTYYGTFLKIALKKLKYIYGTEINDLRKNSANKVLGRDIVRTDFRHGKLSTFETNSIDTVACLETLEHVDDIDFAASEIIRVARKRIIITVPYNQEPRYYLCIHCNKLTPQMNHIHKFDEAKIRKLFKNTHNIYMFKFGINLLYINCFKKLHLPLGILINLDRLISHFRHSSCWLFAIIDK